MQTRLHKLAKDLCAVALLAGALIFLIGTVSHGETLPDKLLVAVSLRVAAVPETLPSIVTMILSRGVHNMVKKNTIIRQIPAVETIDNTSVICSDKTGTLTQSKMRIQKICHVEMAPTQATDSFNEGEILLLELLASCSNATIEGLGADEKIVGDPTEATIIRLLHDKGLIKASLETKYPRVHELPFGSLVKE